VTTELERPDGPVTTSHCTRQGVPYVLLHVPFLWHGHEVAAKVRVGQHHHPEEWCEALREALFEFGYFPNTGIDNYGGVEVWDMGESLRWSYGKYWDGTEWQ